MSGHFLRSGITDAVARDLTPHLLDGEKTLQYNSDFEDEKFDGHVESLTKDKIIGKYGSGTGYQEADIREP